MPLDPDSAHRKLNHAKHLIAAVAWICLLLYSIYLLVDAISGSRPLNIVHVLIPLPLLLVSIRASRRYLKIRSQSGS
jgi:hypothetical protein